MPADLARPTSPAAPAAPRGPALRRLASVASPVLWPSLASVRRIALAGVAATAASIVSGAAVRLSQSGLGCPTWPQCTGRSLVAARSPASSLVHAWVEFGNRLFVGLVMIVAVLVVIAVWRFTAGRPGKGERGPGSRARLRWLSAVQPAGVALQAVLGGIVVLTKLNPVTVSAHFLVSIAILGAAVALYARLAERAGGAEPAAAQVAPVPGRVQGTGAAAAAAPARPELRWLSAALVAVTGLMLAAGTVVTGTGPLAGAPSVPRYRLPLAGVTQFHADIGWLLGGLAVAMVIALRLGGAARIAVRTGWLLLGLIVTQGVIGYAQYFSGLPAGLVWVHVLGATLIWITALRLFFALGPAPAA